MLRYKYSNIYRPEKRTCGDCKLIANCHFHRFKLQKDLDACTEGKFKHEPMEVTSSKVHWILFQIGHQITIANITSKVIADQHFANWHYSDELKENMANKPSAIECYAFRAATVAFIHFLEEKEKEFNELHSSKETTETIIRFVNSILETELTAEGNKITIITHNYPLMKLIRKAVTEEGFKFKNIEPEEPKNDKSKPKRLIKRRVNKEVEK